MSKTARILALLALAVGALVVLRLALNQPSDETLIRTALTEAIQASKEGQPGPVLDFISRTATYNGQQADDRREIGRYIQQYRPSVTVLRPVPTIEGDTATIVSPVKLEMRLLALQGSAEIPNVTIQLRRETALKWFVVPTNKWRVASIEAPADVAATFPSP